MKYNPYGELCSHFGPDAEWEDIETPWILVLLEEDLDRAIALAPSDPTSPEQCAVCLVSQGTQRGWGATKTFMFLRILYWRSLGNPEKIHRAELEGLGTRLVEAFDLAAQTGDWAPVRAELPCEIRVIPPTGDRALERRRQYARASRGRAKSERKETANEQPRPKRLRRDGMVLVRDRCEQLGNPGDLDQRATA